MSFIIYLFSLLSKQCNHNKYNLNVTQNKLKPIKLQRILKFSMLIHQIIQKITNNFDKEY
jgi:hypothetical protein